MRPLTFIDAGYLIALTDDRDELHSVAMRWARAETDSLLVTDDVLVEAMNFFSATRARPRIHAVIEQLLRQENVELVYIGPALFHAGLDLHRDRPDKAWSLTDSISFVVMQRRGISRALAYDHHFEQAGFDALLRRDPP